MKQQQDSACVQPLAVSGETAALLINHSAASLEKDRAVGHLGIPFIQSGRRVAYLVSDLSTWLQSRRVIPETSKQNDTARETA